MLVHGEMFTASELCVWGQCSGNFACDTTKISSTLLHHK